ncbi:MAG: hypothetical protein IT209_13455 [Armatimonadetes bacterium]|nr:hypothetical protein [Armatimonadota bacterium]
MNITDVTNGASMSVRPRAQTSASHPTLSSRVKWLQCTDQSSRFQVDVPASWSFTMEPDQDAVRRTYYAPEYHASVMLEVGEMSADSPRRIWESRDRQLRNVFPKSYILDSITSGMLGGQAASIWTYTIQDAGGKVLRKRDIAVQSKKRLYTLRFCAPADTFSKWQEVFDHIEKSYRFLAEDRPSGRVLTAWAQLDCAL